MTRPALEPSLQRSGRTWTQFTSDALLGRPGRPTAIAQASPGFGKLARNQSRVDDMAVINTYRACGNTAQMVKVLQHRPMPKMFRPVVQRMAPAHEMPGMLRYGLAFGCQMAVDVGVVLAGIGLAGAHRQVGTYAYLRANGCEKSAIVGAYVLLGVGVLLPLLLLL